MLVEAVRTLYRHADWANEAVFDAAEGLTPEQWLAPGTAGHGSIRDTLVHLVACQRAWLGWWDGSMTPEQSFHLIDPADLPDVASVRAAWREVARSTEAFLDRLTEADCGRHYSHTFPWDNQSFSKPLWTMLLHVASHGTQHRSEAAAMLTAHGRSPSYLDFFGFVIEQEHAARLAA